MWLLLSLFSAALTGCVPILAARPSKTVGAEKSAIIRAGIVLIGAGALVLTSGGLILPSDSLIWPLFALAGFFDAAAWLFFYRAIAKGSTELAVIGEKICVPLSILLTCVFSFRFPTLPEWAAIFLFAVGIFYALRENPMILPFLSAVCTAFQMQLSKIGIDRAGSQGIALFLRSIFSLIFLIIFTRFCAVEAGQPKNPSMLTWKTAIILLLSGAAAFFAWKFCFSALSMAPAAQVQAITKLNFWITGLSLSIRRGGINRRCWFAYAAMTVGALVLIA